ncbi:MAG: hypothetical protein AAF497_14875, partial [Planctomycetota bacterium]
FFILFLTFATTEPEQFERMQQSVFGDGGATGLLKKADSALENDSMLLRTRPRSSRLTTRGSETPPINSDPSNASLAKGLESLDDELQHQLETTREINMSLPALVGADEEVTSFGMAMSRKFGQHLVKGPFLINLKIVKPDDIPRAIAFGRSLMQTAGIPFGRVGISLNSEAGADPTRMIVEFSRQWNLDK